MAIVVRGKTNCSVCRCVIGADDRVVLMPHFIWSDAHPLWRFSDSGMRQSCFEGWEHASAFRDHHNEVWPRIMPEHPRRMLPNGTIVDLQRE